MWPHRNIQPTIRRNERADTLLDTLLFTYQRAPPKDLDVVKRALFQVMQEEYVGVEETAPELDELENVPRTMSYKPKAHVVQSSMSALMTNGSSRIDRYPDDIQLPVAHTVSSSMKRHPAAVARDLSPGHMASTHTASFELTLPRSTNDFLPWESTRSTLWSTTSVTDGGTESVRRREDQVREKLRRGQYSLKGAACPDRSTGLGGRFASPRPGPWPTLKKRPADPGEEEWPWP